MGLHQTKKLLQLSALAPSSQKPLHHDSQVEGKANAQAEVQKKKDEAELQSKLLAYAPMEETGATIWKGGGQGHRQKFLDWMLLSRIVSLNLAHPLPSDHCDHL